MKSTQPPPRIEYVNLSGARVPYVVRRSGRARHTRITISSHNGVVVTLPARLPRYINPQEILRDKATWVLKQLERVTIPPPAKPLDEGSIINFRGRPRSLCLTYGGTRVRCRTAGDELRVSLPDDFEGDLKEEIRGWIRKEAVAAIGKLAEQLADEIGVRYSKVTVRDQKTKWGSCSRQGNLSFNWRLILFPPRVMRYIVVHELCHLRHFNHSTRFWDLVERHDRTYRDSVEWLKDHSATTEGDLR